MAADTDGLAPALKHNTELAERAHQLTHQPHQFTIDGLPRKRFVVFQGAISAHEIDPTPRKHEARDLASFVALVKRYGDGDARATVWHGGGELVAKLDDHYRDDQVRLALPGTVARGALLSLRVGALKQEEAVRLMKTSLADTAIAETWLLPLRAVNFVRNEQASGDVGPTRHSFGSNVERKLIGLDDKLPDTVELDVAWWKLDEFSSDVSVRVYFEVLFEERKFRFTPHEDDLQAAEQYAERQLHAWLVGAFKGTTVEVFHGTP